MSNARTLETPGHGDEEPAPPTRQLAFGSMRCRIVAVLTIPVLLLAACGGDDETADDTKTPVTDTSTPDTAGAVTGAPAGSSVQAGTQPMTVVTAAAEASTGTTVTRDTTVVTDGASSSDATGVDVTTGPNAEAAECAAGATLNEGELVVATGEVAYPPYVIDDDPTTGEGFEAAVAYAVAGQLGFTHDQVTWVRTPFDAAIQPGPKDFDFNIQQYSISPEREQAVSFSTPYYVSTQAIFGPADSAAADATDLEALKDLRLGVAEGTTSLSFVEDVIEPNRDPQVFNDNAAVAQAMASNQIDAVIADLPTALYLASGAEDALQDMSVFGQFPPVAGSEGEAWGMLFEKDNPLVDCVDMALNGLTESGELDAITQEWMSTNADVPIIDID